MRSIFEWDRVGALSVYEDGFQHAIRPPTAGRPEREILFETDGPGSHLGNRIFDMGQSRGLQPTQTSFRELGVDALSVAPEFAGATICPSV